MIQWLRRLFAGRDGAALDVALELGKSIDHWRARADGWAAKNVELLREIEVLKQRLAHERDVSVGARNDLGAWIDRATVAEQRVGRAERERDEARSDARDAKAGLGERVLRDVNVKGWKARAEVAEAKLAEIERQRLALAAMPPTSSLLGSLLAALPRPPAPLPEFDAQGFDAERF